MNTDIKVIAGLLASAIWADGEYDDAEKVALAEIADALELDEKAFDIAIDEALKVVDSKNEEELNQYLNECANKVDDSEIGIVFQAAIQLVVCDGTMSIDEIEILLAISNALGISDAMATMFIADMVKTEPELEIEFGE